MLYVAWYVFIIVSVFMLRIILDVKKDIKPVILITVLFLIPILMVAIERIFK